MIQEKQNFSGDLNTKQSLNGSLNNAVIYVDPITQEKEVTPSKQVQEVVPDKGFTGLSKVIVIPYTPVVAKKKILNNGTYKAIVDDLDGYSEVEVATSGADLTEYFKDTISFGDANSSAVNKIITKLPNELTITGTKSANYMFSRCVNLKEIPQLKNMAMVTTTNNMFSNCASLVTIPLLNTSNVTSMYGMFEYCKELESVPLLNTSKVTSMNNIFTGCSSLVEVPLLDTSKVTNMNGMFSNCTSLVTIPQLNTSNVTNMNSMFYGNGSLEQIPQLDTSKVTSMMGMFSNQRKLVTVPQLNASKVNNIQSIFQYCESLKNVGGFVNLGEAFSTTSAVGYYQYTLSLNSSNKLTHDSLMNIINNLYDIATEGCKSQYLQLGSTNQAKLTAEEIAIATEKGWTVR